MAVSGGLALWTLSREAGGVVRAALCSGGAGPLCSASCSVFGPVEQVAEAVGDIFSLLCSVGLVRASGFLGAILEHAVACLQEAA